MQITKSDADSVNNYQLQNGQINASGGGVGGWNVEPTKDKTGWTIDANTGRVIMPSVVPTDNGNAYQGNDISITNFDEGHVINEPNGGNGGIDSESSDPNVTTSTYSPDSGQQGTSTFGQTTTTSIDPKNLDSAITRIWELLFGTGLFGGGNLADVGQQIGSFLKNLETYFNEQSSLDEATRWNYASQVYNMVSSYMSYQLQNYYARQNWVFENEYNSPIHQIARLVESGINPAFYYDSASKDTSSDIGGTDMQSSAIQPSGGSTELQTGLGNAQNALALGGSLASTVSSVGNLFNLVAQSRLSMANVDDIEATRNGRMAQFWANANYLTSQKEALDITLPESLAEMQSRSALNHAMVGNYAVTQAQRWKELEQDMFKFDRQIESNELMARLNRENQFNIADLNSARALLGTKYSANMQYNGTKYSADRSYDAQKYATDEQVKNSRWCKNMDRRMGLELKAMDNLYDDLTYTTYVDETTGKRSRDFAELGLDATDSASVKFGTDGTAMVGGHRIRRDEVKTHAFNYHRMEYANQTILNLVRYNDENYVPHGTMFHYAEKYDQVVNKCFYNWALPKCSAAYGSLIADQFFNTNSMGNAYGQLGNGRIGYGNGIGGLNTSFDVKFK